MPRTTWIVDQNGAILYHWSRTERQWELHPSRNENTAEVAMREDDQITLPDTFLQVFPVVLLDLVDNSVNPFSHLVRTLSSRTPCTPDTEVPILLLDLPWRQSFIISIIPLANFFGEVMGWQILYMLEQKFKRLPCAYARRAVYVTDFCWVKKH